MLRVNSASGLLTLAALVFVWPGRNAAAVTLTTSSAAIQNDTDGQIGLTISGLTAGQKVQVERYADLNGNGVIDPGEPIVQAFRVADGQLPVVGGVRDPNVPGDDDGAADGTITTHVPYPGVDSVSRVAGPFIYRIADSNDAELARAPFAITQNTALPQGVAGTVTAANSGTPLAHVFVVLVARRPIGGTITDANGNYTIYAPPGMYAVVVLASGFVASQPDGSVDISAGAFASKDLALSPASLNVSGTVTRGSNNNGAPGLLVLAESNDGLLAGAFTDAAGQYAFRVTADQWRIAPNEESVAPTGLVAVDKTNLAISGDVSDLNFSLQKATALIYGRVRNAHGDPVLGIGLRADNGAQLRTDGLTLSPDGSYALAVVGGTWDAGPNSEDVAPLGYVAQDMSLVVADGQALQQDFTLQLACAGDCNGDGQVTVDEILAMVNIALGNADVMGCSAGDANGDGQITVDEILTAVNNALNGCGAA